MSRCPARDRPSVFCSPPHHHCCRPSNVKPPFSARGSCVRFRERSQVRTASSIAVTHEPHLRELPWPPNSPGPGNAPAGPAKSPTRSASSFFIKILKLRTATCRSDPTEPRFDANRDQGAARRRRGKRKKRGERNWSPVGYSDFCCGSCAELLRRPCNQRPKERGLAWNMTARQGASTHGPPAIPRSLRRARASRANGPG